MTIVSPNDVVNHAVSNLFALHLLSDLTSMKKLYILFILAISAVVSSCGVFLSLIRLTSGENELTFQLLQVSRTPGQSDTLRQDYLNS